VTWLQAQKAMDFVCDSEQDAHQWVTGAVDSIALSTRSQSGNARLMQD
jgi:hypothetical protein